MLDKTRTKKEVMKKVRMSDISNVDFLSEESRILSVLNSGAIVGARKKTFNDTLYARIETAGGIFTGDNAHALCDRGLSVIMVNKNVGFPSTSGVLLNIQRLDKGIVLGSQQVFQLLFALNGLFYRRGNGNGLSITYNEWVRVQTGPI